MTEIEPEHPRIMLPFFDLPDMKHPDQPCSSRSTLSGFAGSCTFLAGFSAGFIGLILVGSIAKQNLGNTSITFGQIAISLFGIAVAFFVGGEEFLFQAMGFDVYSLPPPQLQDVLKNKEYVLQQNRSLRFNYDIAGILYNIAIFLVFGGLLLAIWPYNPIIATIVVAAGIIVEAIQVIRTKMYTLGKQEQQT